MGLFNRKEKNTANSSGQPESLGFSQDFGSRHETLPQSKSTQHEKLLNLAQQGLDEQTMQAVMDNGEIFEEWMIARD